MTIYIPFTYIIGWSQHKKFYYGARWAKKCQPKDLWTTYFTSSKHVKRFREEFGEPDIIRIHRMFSDKTSCILFEQKYLKTINAKDNILFLNKCNGSKSSYAWDIESREQIKQTCLERYGHVMYLISPVGMEHARLTKVVRYNNKNYNNIEKSKQTCLERYGVDNPQKCETIKEKTTNTLRETYGVDNISQINDVKEKKKNKSLEVYGTEHVLQAEEVKLKIKTTNIERYGVENASNIQVTCPWCNKTGSISGMTSSHFDNCKFNPNATILVCSCGFESTSKCGFATHKSYCEKKK